MELKKLLLRKKDNTICKIIEKQRKHEHQPKETQLKSRNSSFLNIHTTSKTI